MSNSRASTARAVGVEGHGLGGARDPVLGFARFDQRSVQSGQGLGKQRVISRSALDLACGLAKLGERAFRSAEQLVQPGQQFTGLEARLHRRALLGEPRLLAFFGRERLDFAGSMFEPFTVALCRRQPPAQRAARPRSG